MVLVEHAANIIQLLTSADKVRQAPFPCKPVLIHPPSPQGVVTSVTSLLISLASSYPTEFSGVVAVAVNRLHQLVMNSTAAKDDYTYYNVPAPLLTVKLLRLLQLYSFPSEWARRGECCCPHHDTCTLAARG